jgi:hypothetical protein
MIVTPRYTIIRDAGFGAGIPIVGWLLGAKRQLARLDEPWPAGYGVTIPIGYEWDGGSIPSAFWGPPFNMQPWGTHVVAALVHDFWCDIGKGGSDWLRYYMGFGYPKPIPWQAAHLDFYHHCIDSGTNRTRAKLMYQAVKTFGPRWKL